MNTNDKKFTTVTPARRSASSASKTLGILFSSVVLLFVIISVLIIVGEEKERAVWLSRPSTEFLYATKEVCYDSTGTYVLNCGPCGECSNKHDIKIYHETASTLTNIMTKTAKLGFFFGWYPEKAYEIMFKDLKAKVNLTDSCNRCWIENAQCDMKMCLFTCVKHKFLPFLPSITTSAEHQHKLTDPCLACDEALCGPPFAECAGANRRRCGIISDIQRDEKKEVCTKVDWDFILAEESGEKSSAENDRYSIKEDL